MWIVWIVAAEREMKDAGQQTKKLVNTADAGEQPGLAGQKSVVVQEAVAAATEAEVLRSMPELLQTLVRSGSRADRPVVPR